MKFSLFTLILYVFALATSMSGMEIFSLVLCLLLIGYSIKKRPFLLRLPFLFPLITFSAIACIGILFAPTSWEIKIYDLGRLRFFLILYPTLFYSLFYFDPKKRWVPALMVVTAVIGIYGFVQHFIPLDLVRPIGKKIYMYAIQSEKIGPLVLGTYNHHLTFSNIYYLYACFFLAAGLLGDRIKKGPTSLAILLFLVCIWTQSRAAWIAIPIGIFIIVWAKGRRYVGWTCLILVTVFALLYIGDSGFRERLYRTTQGHDDLYSLGPRKRLWHAQWEFFRSHPWFGVGLNNNERMAKQMVDKLYPDRTDNFYGHAHSTPLQILATMGIFGLAAYVWLWATIFKSCWRLRKSPDLSPLGYGLTAAFVGFHIQGLTQWNFGDAEVIHNVIFFWAVLAKERCLSTFSIA